jgi:hypothetical protein
VHWGTETCCQAQWAVGARWPQRQETFHSHQQLHSTSGCSNSKEASHPPNTTSEVQTKSSAQSPGPPGIASAPVEVDSGERETEAHRNKRVFLQHRPEVGNRPWHAKGRMWKCTVVYAHDEILSNKKEQNTAKCSNDKRHTCS